MLPKLFKEIDNECEVKIERYLDGKSVTSLGAFTFGERIELRVTVARRLGAMGVVLRIARDGYRDTDMPLETVGGDELYDVYSLTLDTAELCAKDGCGLFYYELLFLRGFETLFTSTFNNKDFTLGEHPEGRFRLLVYKRDFATPADFGRGVMYHVFVDRFYRGESDVARSVPVRADARLCDDWDNGIPDYPEYSGAPIKNNNFFGGNLWGVAEKLDYLKSLGVTCIYLSPIFEAYSNHKYDTGDYTKIDEMFGGEKAFDNLIEKAREKGILAAVITDAGMTEFHGVPTKTCLALEPLPTEIADELTGNLPLY